MIYTALDIGLYTSTSNNISPNTFLKIRLLLLLLLLLKQNIYIVIVCLIPEFHAEVCDTELFEASCPESSVIMVSKAHYGRMKIGRCVEIDMGFLGCFNDVLDIIDKRCSGRRQCEMRIPHTELENTRPCLKELKNYLDVTYSCLQCMY